MDKIIINTVIEIELDTSDVADLPSHIDEINALWSEYQGKKDEILEELSDIIEDSYFGNDLITKFKLVK